MGDAAFDSALSALAANEGRPSPAEPTSPETLKRELLRLIDEGTDPQVQMEASRLLTCVVDLAPPVDAGSLALIESGVSALTANSRNIRVAKFARNRLEIKLRNQRAGFLSWLSRRLGDSAVYAMLVGVVVSAMIWAVVFSTVLIASALWNEATGSTYIMPPDEASPLAFAAFVGGLVSLLSRVNRFASLYVFDPVLVFVNSLLKPLIGTVFALTAYAIVRAEIIEVSAISFDVNREGHRHVFWTFGFIAGFSERLAGDFIARTESVISRPPDKPDPAR